MSFSLSKKFIAVPLNHKKVYVHIIYEDNWLLVVNKPPKLLTVTNLRRKKGIPTLTEVLNVDFKTKSLPHRFLPCHRLDRETSGLVIYAKGKAVQGQMLRLFRERQIKKTYIAFLHGRIDKDSGKIDFPIEKLDAYTEFKVLERKKDYTVAEVMPYTGRTNQIRIHFKLLGHPLVGEKRFVFRRDFALKANRLCLHAKKLEFIHPITSKVLVLDSELPIAMKNFLNKYN